LVHLHPLAFQKLEETALGLFIIRLDEPEATARSILGVFNYLWCQKIATSVRRRGAPTAGCLQEIDQFLEVDPIADIQEGVGPVEVRMLPACRRRGRVLPPACVCG
jgi:hypothetical protein